MLPSTMFRILSQQTKTKGRTVSTLVCNTSLSKEVVIEKQILNRSKHLFLRNMSSNLNKILENQPNSSSKRPYTVVVEGNIGSGKVIYINIKKYEIEGLRLETNQKIHDIYFIIDNISCSIYEQWLKFKQSSIRNG